jgi:chromosome segregation ATPase
MTTQLNDKNDSNEDRYLGTAQQPQRAPVHVLWYVAIGVALVAIVGLFVDAHQLTTQMSRLNDSTQAQIAKLSDQVAQSSTESARQAELVAQDAHDTAASVEQQARTEARKTAATLSAKLAKQGQAEQQAQQQVAGELENLKAANTDASSKLNAISGDVSTVKGDVSSVRGDVASTQAEVEKTGSELKRMTGDMGVMSGLIATNGEQLSALKELGQRNYQEFDIKRTGGLQKIGTIQLALSKADPKRNRFTLDVLADDKRVQKRDRTINEPVQFYLAGNRQPVEIVVNEVKKDEVVGYVALPKVRTSRP